jgi:hypothetical protein
VRASGPGQPAEFLLDVVDVLDRLGMPYAVIGGFAASFHGQERATSDGDAAVWTEKTTLKREDLAKELRDAGFQVELRSGAPDDPIGAVFRIHGPHGNRVDLLQGVRGMSLEAPSRAITSSLMGREIRMIGAEDFVAMKISSGGPKDLEDVRGVLEVSGDNLDLPLLKKLSRRYGAAEARVLASLLKKNGFSGS